MRNRNDSPKDSHEIFEVDSSSTDSADFMNNAEVTQIDLSKQEETAHSSSKESDSLSSTSDLIILDSSTFDRSNNHCGDSKSNSNGSSQQVTVKETNVPADDSQKNTEEATLSGSNSPSATYRELDIVVDDKKVESDYITKPLTPPSRAEDHVFKRPKTPPRKTNDHVFKRPKTPPRKADNVVFKRPMTPPRKVHNVVTKVPPSRIIYNRVPTLRMPYGPPCGNPDSNPYGNPYAPVVEEESLDDQIFGGEFSILSRSTENSIEESNESIDLDSLPKSKNYRRYSPFPDQMFNIEDNVNNEQCTINNNLSVNTHDNDVSNIEVISHAFNNTNNNDISKDDTNIERISYTPTSITKNEISNDESTIKSIPPTSSTTSEDEVVKDVTNREITLNQSNITTNNEMSNTNKDTKMPNTSYTSLSEGIMMDDVDTSSILPTAGSKETVNMNTETTNNTSPSSNEELFNEEAQIVNPKAEKQLYDTNTESAINEISPDNEAVSSASEPVVEGAHENKGQSKADEKVETSITVSKDGLKESKPVVEGIPDDKDQITNDEEVEAAIHTDVSSSEGVMSDHQSAHEEVSTQEQAFPIKKKGRGRPRKAAPTKKKTDKAQSQDVASDSMVTDPPEDLPPRSRKAPKRYREEVDEATRTAQSNAPEVSENCQPAKRKYRRKGKESSAHADSTIEEVVPVPARVTRGRKRNTVPVEEVPVEISTSNETVSADMQTEQNQQAASHNIESSTPTARPKRKPANRANYFDVTLNADNADPLKPTARSKRQATSASKNFDTTSEADISEATKSTARPRRKTANVVNYSDADNGESSSTARPKRRSAGTINYSEDIPGTYNAEPSKPATRAKRKLSNVVNYSDDASLQVDNILSVEPENEIPTPKRSKGNKGKSTARSTKGKAKSVAEEVKETEIADPPSTPTKKKAEKGKAAVQQVDRNSLDFLLTNKESFLTNEEFKEQVVEWISKLNKAEKQELVKYLPDVDLDVQGNTLKWDEKCAFLSHPYLWQGVEQWQEILSYGGFEKEGKTTGEAIDEEEGRNEDDKEEKKEQEKKEQEKKEGDKEDGGFKDDNFESYWGERLHGAK